MPNLRPSLDVFEAAPDHAAAEPARQPASRRWSWGWTGDAIGVLALCALAAALLTGCSGSDKPAAQQGAGGPPAVPVGVVTVQAQSVPLLVDLPGRLEPIRTAEVRARVAGVVQQRLFTEGGLVKAGQSLFTIDPATYQAALDSALASQARAEAQQAQAAALLARYEPLKEAKAISPQEFLNAQVAQRQAQAEVAAAKAAVRQARIQLDHAAVRAPISGRIGRALVTEGALVGQGEATQLAVIQQTDTLYVNITQSASEVMALKRAMAAGQIKSAGASGAQVRIRLEDGSLYSQPARLLFTDLTVDPASGQVSLRAEVPNPQGALLPGLYVRVQIEQGRAEGGFLIPQQAVSRQGSGDTVRVVAADGSVSVRPVKLGQSQGTDWVVLDGLKAGEQVMVDGFQKLMAPGMKAKPVPWTPPAASAPAAPAASAASAAQG
ncbi:efflux RND transporter periplasmic adaptor subunit [Aquabacterium fontiphilum]|jgi:membrane fusion protein (multidrug efflux system)|uniref:efflux RND transporter periplasmic adaptor subunit n=1 Tax=Aquabacterium fontiphilum TaxID=450365 RepID=UPI0013769AFA|nr:efflux RND transporter periplasmic adaptor subunit [Aquabacterium fontiphilum]NBD20797.1 efflux RND transporter periplasmic adaptor subunit [Aquabacterium fontiphilum]